MWIKLIPDVNTPDAASTLGITTKELANMRKSDTGPKYYAESGRYWYRYADLEVFRKSGCVEGREV